MPLPIIDEETVLASSASTSNESRPLGHSAIYGASSDDNTSIFSCSTNSTASNLVGPGRVLGNAYSFAGKRLERTLGDLAHKAGFSPEAIYQQISTLYLEDWKTDGKKASMLQKLCFKLFKQIKSIADSTRFRAIMRWRDILRDQHEIYVWLFSSQRERMVKHASALLRVIEELQSTINTLSDFQDAVLSETSLLIDFHSVGLNVINFNRARLLIEGGNFHLDWTGATDIHREETEKWDLSLQYLLKSLSDPTISELSQWYIEFWSSQIVQGNVHATFVLQSCLTLRSVLKAVDPSHTDCWDALAVLGKNLHEYVVGKAHSRTFLLAQGDDFMPWNGVPVHISTLLNDLVRSYNRVFSSELDIVPDLTCITMLGSTDLISADDKDNIRGFLNDLQNDDKVKDKSFTKLMFLRSCYRLLRRALSELDDTDCLNRLSNATSFTDGTSRCAILQLGDILQSLPEVYMLLMTLGGNEIRDFVETLCQSLKVYDKSTRTLERYPRILINLRSLLECHAAGLLEFEDMPSLGYSEASQFITSMRPAPALRNLREARKRFVPYLIDNLTFNPLIFYLNYCISRFGSTDYSSHNDCPFLSCFIVQGVLLTDKSVPQENRSAMEELCRTMQNSIIEHLSSALKSFDGGTIYFAGQAMRSVYTDLTEARHVRTFEDEAEAYLLQLCNLFFENVSNTKDMSYKRDMITELSDFFEPRNVFGWFLSNRGPDAEGSISRLLRDIDDSQIFDPKEDWSHTGKKRRLQLLMHQFSHLDAHKSGVELLAPRNEKLQFEGAGLTKHLSSRSSEPPLTPEQTERWTNAFQSMVSNLRSSDLILIDISLFYFANCLLPYEADPMFDTAIALDSCESLRLLLTESYRDSRYDSLKKNSSRAVSHIHTCLTKRVEYVQQSCMDVTGRAHTFYETPFDIPKVINVLNGLAKLCEARILSKTRCRWSSPNY